MSNKFLLIAFLAFLVSPAVTAELNGQIASELYLSETDGRNHVRSYERLRANLVLMRSTTGRSLLLHSYLRWRTDLSEKGPNDPQTFVYNTYLKLTGVPDGSAFYLGRQFIYNGAGSVHMDGLRFAYKPFRRISVDIFGGSTVSRLDPERIRSLSDFGTLGGRMSYSTRTAGSIALNWMLTRSDGYTIAHRGGLDGQLYLGRFRFYGRFIFNIASIRVADVVARTTYTGEGWNVSGEYRWREPSVSSKSLFSLIDFYRYQEVRLDIQRRVWRYVSAVGQVHAGLFERDESWRFGIGVRSSIISIMWRHQEGYGGINDGLYGNATIRFLPQWDAYVDADLGRYRIQELQDERNDSYAGRFGIRWRAGHGILAQSEIQYLRNAVENNDVRLFLRISTDFSWAGGGATTR